MEIDKNTILDFLRQHGREDQVPQAERELPDQVDPERDSGLLSRFGIDVGELLAKLPEGLRDKIPGGLTDKLGGFLDK
jgi:DNA-directed RNA polymerase specialized sigma24 family protein